MALESFLALPICWVIIVYQTYTRLKERVKQLGNHHQKYLRTIDRYLDALIGRLEDAGKMEEVHLWKGSPRLEAEMDVVISVGNSLDEKLAYLACYYSLQMLHLNLRSIDVLMLNVTATADRTQNYKQFMLLTGAEFRNLTAAYMRKVLDLISPAVPLPEFTLLSVGSLAHQDDIDVGVIDDGSPGRQTLNVIIGKLRREMFKWATELHFYLSEHLGTQFYTASIPEYKMLLEAAIQDFVIISEMLNATPILGSQRLFDQFEQEIIYRYHYHSYRDAKFHEGYLRGILGEIRSLLLRQVTENKLTPKDDALRMVSSLILAGKTIFQIYRGNRWEVLEMLARKDSARREVYRELEEVLTFLEILRHLYQLFVGLEEDIYLDDQGTIEQMELVARVMGYQNVGAISAWDHLLIHYYEHVDKAKRITARLIADVTDHLKAISKFSIMTKSAWYPAPYRSYPGNLAIDFLRESNFFRGARFWDDILESLEAEGSHVLENFIDDLQQLRVRHQYFVISRYARAARNAIYAMISFLIVLSRNKHKLQIAQLCDAFNQEFLTNLASCEDCVMRLTRVFHQYPQVINTYLTTLKPALQRQFAALLDRELWEPEQQKSKQLLVRLCEIHCNTSHYFKRFFMRVVSQYPIYIQYLADPATLAQISKGMVGRIDSLDSFEAKKKQLGDYHDLELMRLGLEVLQGAEIEKIDAEFIEFSDFYLEVLFDICKQAADEKLGREISLRDLMAIYAAGGYAREQAFDDDFDLIILLNEKDDPLREHCNRIVRMMNNEIVKRGIMPHYRFADHFGHYVTLVDDLDEYFSKEKRETFIDKSQVLGARMIVGSRKFRREFEQRIIQPHIFDKYEQYRSDMITEMRSRQQDRRNNPLNIKECQGGLRDIEVLLLIYKARYRLAEPINRKLMKTICEVNAKHHEDLYVLNRNFNFLKRLRDLYRLTVFAGNDLNLEHLGPAATIMGYQSDQQGSAVDKLAQDYYRCTQETSQIVDRLLAELVA